MLTVLSSRLDVLIQQITIWFNKDLILVILANW